MDDAREVESTLLISSATPEAVAARLVDLEGLRGFLLQNRDSQSIHDIYFDLGDRSLENRKPLQLGLERVDLTLELLSTSGSSKPAVSRLCHDCSQA